MQYIPLIDLPMLMVGSGLDPECTEAVLDPGFPGVWICGCWSGAGEGQEPKATGVVLAQGQARSLGPWGLP